MRKRKTKFWVAFSILLVAAGIFIFTAKDLSIHGYDEQTSKEDSVSQSTNSNVEKVNLDGYLFLGDSYTFLLKETIESHNPKASVCAKSGVQPVYWNENFNTLPDNEQVNGVVLLIGVNGVTYDDNLPNKKMLIDSLVEKYQGKTIYVQKVFPVGENFENANPVTFNAAIKSHNEEIEDNTKSLTERKTHRRKISNPVLLGKNLFLNQKIDMLLKDKYNFLRHNSSEKTIEV